MPAHVRQRAESFRPARHFSKDGHRTGNKPGRAFVGADVTVPSSIELLTHRLDQLRAERAATMTDNLRDGTGDVADRATNVEASIRLQLLDERIALLELEIDESRRHRHSAGVVSVGDFVRVDLGDGPEEYVVGSVEQAIAGVPTVTPGSPVGRAIVGAAVGSTVAYEPRRGVRVEVRILEASPRLAPSA
jgi:transcription elongation factor GreA